MSIIKELKRAIKNQDKLKASKLLMELYIENPRNIKKTLLLSNSLNEPLARTCDEKKIKFMVEFFEEAIKMAIEKGITDISPLLDIMVSIFKIYKSVKDNTENLNKNNFINYSLAQKIQTFCVYLEDHRRLIESQKTKTEFITGMESEVAKYKAYNMEKVLVSENDDLEAMIEIGDSLFRYFYYKYEDEEKKGYNNYQFIQPYNNQSFVEMIYLALERQMLEVLWGKYKYRNWKLEIKKRDKNSIYLFVPENKKEFFVERIAVDRYIHENNVNIQEILLNNIKSIKKSDFKANEISKNINFKNIYNIFKIEKSLFNDINFLTKQIIKGQKKLIDPIYFDVKKSGIEIEDLFLGYEYLYTISLIYKKVILNNFNQDNLKEYEYLAPIFYKKYFIKQFSELYNLDFEKAKKIINIFVFSKTSELDLFSQPLISVGEDKIVFSPTLILQVNMIRVIEMIVKKWKINISDKGIKFENQLRIILNLSPNIQVNQNKIEFMAYDGKQVEFDFIGLFEDFLILIEFKHTTIPFSEKERNNTLETIDYGVEQVNRRIKVINNDWNKIKEGCSFNLPEKKIEEDKIIKLVCTNIFDFTTLVRQDVTIIDSSSLLSFFINPEIKLTTLDKNLKIKNKPYFWRSKNPTVKEFINFIKNPIAFQAYKNAFSEINKPLSISKEINNLQVYDLYFKEDPHKKYIKNNFKISTPVKKTKIGRNKSCPCGSGLKYKKCCGKSR